MTAIHSSDALELKLVEGIIEIKIEGERLPETGEKFAREFKEWVPIIDSSQIVLDIREAYHPLSNDEWEHRIARAADLFAGYTLALVKRPDQMPESMALQKAHEASGGVIKTFSHKGDALNWISDPLA